MGLTAEEVKDALRRRHPAYEAGFMGVGRWTCLEELAGIDLLALDAWQAAARIGYEVKVSRADMRTELLKPHKRAVAVAMCTRFYIAVPAGMLTADELAFQEPLDVDQTWFERERCPGITTFGSRPAPGRSRGYRLSYGGQCNGTRAKGRAHKLVQPYTIAVPKPVVLQVPEWVKRNNSETWWTSGLVTEQGVEKIKCPTCNGKGYVDKCRAEREFPTLWVPNDIGLVEIDGRGVHVAREAPSNPKPQPLLPEAHVRPAHAHDQEQAELLQNRLDRQSMHNLIRWVSARPDPRHAERGNNR